jgi:hypothetical protein
MYSPLRSRSERKSSSESREKAARLVAKLGDPLVH